MPEVATVTNIKPTGWQASLQLQLVNKGLRTVLQSVQHKGPLRVQRPFYPEGPVCHLYLLHPPGGMVAGDNLSIDVALAANAQGLITTPAAGKLYRVESYAESQYQGVHADLQQGAVLEWLPQETIVFNGARGELLNRFDLAKGAAVIGWDIVCLGRRASGETFESGEVKQRIEIYREGKPVFLDRVCFEGGSRLLASPWGMNGQSVSGTFFATVTADEELSLDALRASFPQGREWGLTRRGDVVLGRYLGHSAEECRRGFEKLWGCLRPILTQRPVHRPRIWNT